MISASERVAREDLITFLNACHACTGQREFYGAGEEQRLGIEFLHEYVLGNYRSLYARSLACGINHFNQALVVANLLSTGRKAPPGAGREEGLLIARALERLPAHRAMHLLEELARRRVNNRRTRAVVRDYLAGVRDPDFLAVKYRRSMRRAASHAHAPLRPDCAAFLRDGARARSYETPLFEAFRRAHYAREALYELPFSVAEGLANKFGVPRDVFLRRIEPRLTAGERLRLQGASEGALGRAYELDARSLPLTKLASYVLSLPLAEREKRAEELDAWLGASARRAARRSGASFGRVACVLDRSYSSSGSSEKRRRPLALALSIGRFLREASSAYAAFWTTKTDNDLLVTPFGTTGLAGPIIDALSWGPDLVVVVSDGYENDPPGAAGEVVRVARARLGAPPVVHLNPVFDARTFAPRGLGAALPTVGVRDADEVPMLLTLCLFASGGASLADLERHFESRARAFLEGGRAADLAMYTSTTLSFKGLTAGAPQSMGAFRLVPLLRDNAPGDLRIASRGYGRNPAVVGVDSAPLERGTKYVSYVPHGFVVSYSNDGSEAAFGAKLGREAGAFRGVNLLHRMVKGEASSAEGGRFRMLPLHLAMEGFLALHFGGPDVLWGEYSRHVRRFGLSPRVETSVAGAGLEGFDEALRVFEIAPSQAGSIVLVAGALAAAFVVSHPDDYRRLHRSLLEDFYGDLVYRYALYYPEPARDEAGPFDGGRVTCLDDLRAELGRARRHWADFAALAAAGLDGREARAEAVREAGPFNLERFTTKMRPDDECHIGERIVRDDGTLEYMKTYRLSDAQVRRGFLLETLAGVGWRFDEAAAKLGATRDELARRLNNAGLGYILSPGLLEAALRKS